MADLTRSLERVAHVPGVLRRRALMVGLTDRAKKPVVLAKYTRHAPVVADANLLIHDAIATAVGGTRNEPGASDRNTGFFKEIIQFIVQHARAKSAAYRTEPLADAFVTAATLGDVALLRTLFEESLEMVGMNVDFAKLMQVACACGHRAVVAWLWALTTDVELRIFKMQALRRIEPIREALMAGARSALDVLERDDDMAMYIRTLLCVNDTPPPSQGPLLIDDSSQPATNESLDRTLTMPTDESTLRQAGTALLIEPTSSIASVVAVRVVTSRSLMSIIGSFQENPHVLVDPLVKAVTVVDDPPPMHAAARLAIIYGDIHVFKAACLLSQVRPSDLPLLLHFAACEGRLDMVCWLHRQFVDDVKCRPDTMAMAVRCGWPEVVAWLHSHCPESAQTMTAGALNEAARWGHVDVLRLCHTYHLGEPTPELLASAIQAGRLDVVQLLHSLEWGYDRIQARSEALKYGQLGIVRWLYTEEVVSTGCLVEALCSNVPTAQETVAYTWSLIDPTSELVVRCIAQNFSTICPQAVTTTITTILPLVPPNSEVMFEGLLAATKAVCRDNVKLLLPHWQLHDADQLDSLLQAAFETEDTELLRWFISQSCVGTINLDRLFELAAERQTSYMNHHVKKSIKGIQIDPLSHFVMNAIRKRRQRDRKQSGVESTRQDDRLEVERALLTSVSDFARPHIVTFFIGNGQPLHRGESAVTALITQADGIMRLKKPENDNQDELTDALSDKLTLRCARSNGKGTLISPYCAVNASRTGNLNVLKFLLKQDLLPSFMLEVVVAIAYTHGQLSILEWLRSHGVSLASEPGIRYAMACNQMEIVIFAIDLHDDGVDRTIQCILLEKLREDVEKADAFARRGKHYFVGSKTMGWAMPLLQLVMHKRPDQHQRLLEIAAESGLLPAVEYILGPRSTFDVSTMLLPDALIAAARGKNEAVVKALYASKLDGEQIDIRFLRDLGGLSGVGAVETLLVVLSEWDPHVKAQLEREREKANVFLPPTGPTGSSNATPRERARHRSGRCPSRSQRPRPVKLASQT